MSHEKKGPVTSLKERMAQIEADCKHYKDDYLRAVADFENYRKRNERDISLARRQELERLLVDLLPVVDDFDRAMAHADADCAAVRKGMEMISRQLRDVLCRHGLEEYSCKGQEFDPRRAEAISFVHSDEHEPNTVVEEACKGFSCDGRVLRPARVVVAKAPLDDEQPDADSTQDAAGS
jgi:molecular chaperone GrpE